MFNKFKHIKNEKGLTLIELLAVIVILAIIAAIAIPAIGNIIENSRYNAAKSDAINVLSAANIYFTDNGDKTEVTVEDLKKDGYLESEGKVEKEAKIKKATDGNGNTIDTAITYSGSKKLTLTAATVKMISEDKQKGSGEGPTISAK
ncbi:MAG: prepilin-type N-terminal cleavage/methylation domain-containing protein [Lysinibacillus sp.]